MISMPSGTSTRAHSRTKAAGAVTCSIVSNETTRSSDRSGSGMAWASPVRASIPYFLRACSQTSAEISTPTTLAAPALAKRRGSVPSPQAMSSTLLPRTKSLAKR